MWPFFQMQVQPRGGEPRRGGSAGSCTAWSSEELRFRRQDERRAAVPQAGATARASHPRALEPGLRPEARRRAWDSPGPRRRAPGDTADGHSSPLPAAEGRGGGAGEVSPAGSDRKAGRRQDSN